MRLGVESSQAHDKVGLQEWFRKMDEIWDGLAFDPIEISALDAERVIAVVRTSGRAKASGIDIDQTLTHVWTLREGKAIRFDGYSTKRQALEAAGLSGSRCRRRSSTSAYYDAAPDAIEPLAMTNRCCRNSIPRFSRHLGRFWGRFGRASDACSGDARAYPRSGSATLRDPLLVSSRVPGDPGPWRPDGRKSATSARVARQARPRSNRLAGTVVEFPRTAREFGFEPTSTPKRPSKPTGRSAGVGDGSSEPPVWSEP